MQSESPISTTSRNVTGFSGLELIWDVRCEAKWKVGCGLTSPQIVFGNHGRCVLWANEQKDHLDCYQHQVKKLASVMVWGCVSAHGTGNLHICEGTIKAERYMQVLEQHILPSKQCLVQRRPCLFMEDNVEPHSTSVTTAGIYSKRVGGTRLACLQSRHLSHWKCVAYYEGQNMTAEAPLLNN